MILFFFFQTCVCVRVAREGCFWDLLRGVWLCFFFLNATSAQCVRFSVISQHLWDKCFHLNPGTEAREREGRGKQLEGTLKLKEKGHESNRHRDNQESQETMLTERMWKKVVERVMHNEGERESVLSIRHSQPPRVSPLTAAHQSWHHCGNTQRPRASPHLLPFMFTHAHAQTHTRYIMCFSIHDVHRTLLRSKISIVCR